MMTPTIHANGTPAGALFEGYVEAANRTRAALEAVAYTAPNGRDYYPQGQAAMEQAQVEHISRLERLQALAEELEALALHCAQQKKEGGT